MNRVGIAVECSTCRRTKAPHGRSVPELRHGAYFTDEGCAGYWENPQSGCLWPSETSEQFGYHHCDSATDVQGEGE